MSETSPTIQAIIQQVVAAGGDTLFLAEGDERFSFRKSGRLHHGKDLTAEDVSRLISDVIALPHVKPADETALPVALLKSPDMPVEGRWTVPGTAVGIGDGHKVRFTLMALPKGRRWISGAIMMVFPGKAPHWMEALPVAGSA